MNSPPVYYHSSLSWIFFQYGNENLYCVEIIFSLTTCMIYEGNQVVQDDLCSYGSGERCMRLFKLNYELYLPVSDKLFCQKFFKMNWPKKVKSGKTMCGIGYF